MSEGSPLWGAGNVRPKTSASGTELYKIIIQLHPQCRILRKAKPLTQLMKSRVCHEFACPIVPWVPPCSCTTRIPKQHSFDPPVRRQIRHMHCKFPMMFEAMFRPRVHSMSVCFTRYSHVLFWTESNISLMTTSRRSNMAFVVANALKNIF